MQVQQAIPTQPLFDAAVGRSTAVASWTCDLAALRYVLVDDIATEQSPSAFLDLFRPIAADAPAGQLAPDLADSLATAECLTAIAQALRNEARAFALSFRDRQNRPIRLVWLPLFGADEGQVVLTLLDDSDARESPDERRDHERDLLERLEAHNALLRAEMERDLGAGPLIGRSRQVAEVAARLRRVAPTHTPVLLTGGPGSGKGQAARLLHRMSDRRHQPFVKIACGAADTATLGGELFGEEQSQVGGPRRGRIELANGGTVFLDEVCALPLDFQTRLVQLLRDGRLTRLGAARSLPVDVRVIASSRRSLAAESRAGRFRDDLLYSLTVFPVALPSLRERPDDIPLIAAEQLRHFARRSHKPITGFSADAERALESYDWPGNLRELRSVVDRAVLRCTGDEITLADLSGIVGDAATAHRAPDLRTMAEVEHDHLLAVLEHTDWVIEGPAGAAQLLGLAPATLRSRLKKHGLQRPSSAAADPPAPR